MNLGRYGFINKGLAFFFLREEGDREEPSLFCKRPYITEEVEEHELSIDEIRSNLLKVSVV